MIPIEELFPTEEEKVQAKEELAMLKETQGWKVMEKLLDFDIKKLDNDLKTRQYDSLEEQRAAQDMHAVRVLLKDYPNIIIQALSDEQGEKVELDPYEPGKPET